VLVDVYLAELIRFSTFKEKRLPFNKESLSERGKAAIALERGGATTSEVDVTVVCGVVNGAIP